MSQNTRADVPTPSAHGRISKLLGSGLASTSDSCTRENPSIDEPSKRMPSSNAPSSSTGEMANDLSWPSTSVNHRRIMRTPRSSTVRSTYSRWRSELSMTGMLGRSRPTRKLGESGSQCVHIWATGEKRPAGSVAGR
jgi:hypothetical protein